jgi:tetratricopeptide (TPR) repeat protein
MRSTALFRHLLLLFLTLWATVSFAQVQGQHPPANIAPIIDSLQHHDFLTALKLSQKILASEPGNYTVWTLRGMASAGIGNPTQALAAYQHALRLAPAYLPAMEGAAQTEFQLKRPETRDMLLRILTQRPEDPTTHLLLGMLDFSTGKCPDAVHHFAKADHALAVRPESLNEYGACLAQLKRLDDAVAVFTRALSLKPVQQEARYDLALAQWQDNKPDDALATLKPLVESAPVSSDALALSAEILEARQDTVQAVALLRKAILADPKNIDPYLDFASLSFDHASPQAGIDILNAGMTQLPNEPKLYLVRGILLTQLGDFTRAAQDLETASRITPHVQFLGVAEGLVESQQHNSAQALARFRAAVKLHPNDAYAHYLLAEALDGEGKHPGSAEYKEEVDAATKAVKLDSHLVAARDLLASIYLENGQTDLAIQESREAIALDPKDQQAVYHLILALRRTDQKDQIPSLLKRLMELRADPANHQPGAKQYRLTIAKDANGVASQ